MSLLSRLRSYSFPTPDIRATAPDRAQPSQSRESAAGLRRLSRLLREGLRTDQFFPIHFYPDQQPFWRREQNPSIAIHRGNSTYVFGWKGQFWLLEFGVAGGPFEKAPIPLPHPEISSMVFLDDLHLPVRKSAFLSEDPSPNAVHAAEFVAATVP